MMAKSKYKKLLFQKEMSFTKKFVQEKLHVDATARGIKIGKDASMHAKININQKCSQRITEDLRRRAFLNNSRTKIRSSSYLKAWSQMLSTISQSTTTPSLMGDST